MRDSYSAMEAAREARWSAAGIASADYSRMAAEAAYEAWYGAAISAACGTDYEAADVTISSSLADDSSLLAI